MVINSWVAGWILWIVSKIWSNASEDVFAVIREFNLTIVWLNRSADTTSIGINNMFKNTYTKNSPHVRLKTVWPFVSQKWFHFEYLLTLHHFVVFSSNARATLMATGWYNRAHMRAILSSPGPLLCRFHTESTAQCLSLGTREWIHRNKSSAQQMSKLGKSGSHSGQTNWSRFPPCSFKSRGNISSVKMSFKI